jgi:plastocyanin
MKPAAAILVAWLALSPLLLSLQPAHSDVPYFGILRGWENGGVNQIIGYDIAADESGIYIAGEYFGYKSPGFGPMVMFLNPDHTFRCQNVLRFRVDDSRGVPRSGAYSIALTDDSVIVAGVYGDWGGFLHVARLFIAVFNKRDCGLTGIKELIDESLTNEWVNLYPFFVSGVKVVWDQASSSMFVMLQTREATTFSVPHLYIIQLNTRLDILNAVRYDLVKDGSDNFYVSDMFDGGSILYVTGTYIDENRKSHILYGEISKKDFIAFWYYFPLSFPGYDVRVEEFLPLSRIVLTFGDVGGWTYVNIAFTMECSGRDCAVGVSEAFRLGILRFPLGIRNPRVEVRLYDFTTTHWNTPRPYNHDNNTWVTRVVEAGGVLYIVGFLNIDLNWLIYDQGSRSYSLAPDLDGFVYAVDSRTLDAQYMFRVVSLDGPPSSGGSRVPSAVLGAGSYNGYAYITGTAGNYYLEFTPFNPRNITGTATRNDFILTTGSHNLKELLPPNFQGEGFNDPVFDQDAHPSTAGFYGVLRLKPATTTTSTTTSTVTETTTSTTTETSTSTATSTTTSTTTRTVTSTPTTTVTRFTTSTQTAVATVVQTEYVFSTVYTTRVVEGTVTRVETVTSVTTIPYVTTLTDTTTLRSVVTATTTPTVYATVQTTVLRNMTTYLTTTKTVQPPDTVPWWYILFPFIPLLLLPPVVVTTRGRLKITILEGAGEQQPGAQPSDILSEYFKPSVGRLQKNGKATFINKDRTTHTVEIYTPEEPGRIKTLTLKPGQKAQIKFKEPGRYFFRLQTNPDKIGILQVE